MFGSRQVLSAVSTATLIALGSLLTWYAALVPLAAYYEGRKARSRFYEQVTVLSDGTPLLAVSRVGQPAAEYRDLQGEIVARGQIPTLPNVGGLQPAQQKISDLPHPIASSVSLPVEMVNQGWSWSRRIMGLSDQPGTLEGPTTLWYFIRGPRNQGGGYFEGYDEGTRQLVGFIGANGYQATRPVGEQRFVLGEDFDIHRIATAQYAYFGQASPNYYLPMSVGTPEKVYMALPDRVVQIDLRRRTVSTLAEIAHVLAIAFSPGSMDDGSPEGIYARTPENLINLNADGSVRERFSIPSEARNDNLIVYRLANNEVVLDATRNYYDRNHRLLWVGAEGKVARRVEVQLDVPDDFGGFTMAVFAPGPLAMVVATIIDATQIQPNRGISYSESWANALARCAAPAIFYFVLSAVLAWIVYRREKLDGQRGVGWTAFVFLLGVPGVVGYLFHRDRSARISCELCEKPVLRNRPECSACGEPFAQPGRLGTEIFA